jgi:hypothetical protein
MRYPNPTHSFEKHIPQILLLSFFIYSYFPKIAEDIKYLTVKLSGACNYLPYGAMRILSVSAIFF